jgi:hypothetical protein
VGVIDYVGQHQSRVRLITDNHLTPSVRVARGGMQDHFINEEISLLLHLLEHKKWLSHNEHVELQALLTKLQEVLKPFKKTWALAKGELQGSRSLSKQNGLPILKGSGFNYDFPDEEGEARDLRTGNLIHKSTSQAIALLQVGDLLITTGMDGVFPPGLKVATIAKIDLLKEGDYFYELEAIPTAGNLQDLSVVFVIPPVGYDPNDF